MKPALTGPSLFVLLLAAPFVPAEVAIPTVGQPSPFYGAAGHKVIAEATAEPTALTLDDTITFTLRVRNLDNAPDVRRPDLGELEAFRDFQVDDDPTQAPEPAGTRVFRYHLRPRRATVTAIPAVVFPYYDPREPQPSDRPDFPFRKARTEPIPIRVQKAAPPPALVVPLEVPDFAAAPATASPADLPRWAWWLAAVLPPVAAVGGCVVWRILNPAGARLARRRRSRAARAALKTLHALGRHPPADPAPGGRRRRRLPGRATRPAGPVPHPRRPGRPAPRGGRRPEHRRRVRGVPARGRRRPLRPVPGGDGGSADRRRRAVDSPSGGRGVIALILTSVVAASPALPAANATESLAAADAAYRRGD